MENRYSQVNINQELEEDFSFVEENILKEYVEYHGGAVEFRDGRSIRMANRATIIAELCDCSFGWKSFILPNLNNAMKSKLEGKTIPSSLLFTSSEEYLHNIAAISKTEISEMNRYLELWSARVDDIRLNVPMDIKDYSIWMLNTGYAYVAAYSHFYCVEVIQRICGCPDKKEI